MSTGRSARRVRLDRVWASAWGSVWASVWVSVWASASEQGWGLGACLLTCPACPDPTGWSTSGWIHWAAVGRALQQSEGAAVASRSVRVSELRPGRAPSAPSADRDFARRHRARSCRLRVSRASVLHRQASRPGEVQTRCCLQQHRRQRRPRRRAGRRRTARSALTQRPLTLPRERLHDSGQTEPAPTSSDLLRTEALHHCVHRGSAAGCYASSTPALERFDCAGRRYRSG